MAENFDAEKGYTELLEMFVYIKDHMVTKDDLTDELAGLRTELKTDIATLREELGGLREELGGKIDGIHRALDAGFERDGALDARVTKIEAVLHLEH